MKCEYCAEPCERVIDWGGKRTVHEACEPKLKQGWAKCVQCGHEAKVPDVSPYVVATPSGKNVERWLCHPTAGRTCAEEWRAKYLEYMRSLRAGTRGSERRSGDGSGS